MLSGVLPPTIYQFGNLKPIYETLEGWQTDTRNAVTFGELPEQAQTFIRFIEQTTQKEISFISTNAEYDVGMVRTRHS